MAESTMDKLLSEIPVRVSDTAKARIKAVAEAHGMSLSEYVRCALDEKLERDRMMYESLHIAFANDK